MWKETRHDKVENVFHFCDFSTRWLNLKNKQNRMKKEKSARAMTVSFAKCKKSCESPKTGVLCGLPAALVLWLSWVRDALECSLCHLHPGFPVVCKGMLPLQGQEAAMVQLLPIAKTALQNTHTTIAIQSDPYSFFFSYNPSSIMIMLPSAEFVWYAMSSQNIIKLQSSLFDWKLFLEDCGTPHSKPLRFLKIYLFCFALLSFWGLHFYRVVTILWMLQKPLFCIVVGAQPVRTARDIQNLL